MSFGCTEVDQATFSDQEDSFSICQDIFISLMANARILRRRVLLEPSDIDFDIEVTGVSQDRAILHQSKMLSTQYVAISRHGDEDISDLCSLVHRHDAISLHHGIEGLGWIDLSDDDICTETSRSLRNSLTAITESSYDNDLACEQDVGGTEDRIESRLPGAVSIVEHVLGIGVIDRNHRECQSAILRHLT